MLSDLYAFGVVNCDNVLMILAVSLEMSQLERDVVTKKMIEGFTAQIKAAETVITGGQTVLNPWPIIGGTAVSICSKDEFINPENVQNGDVIVLTKPLGTQVAVNVYQWLNLKDKSKWNKISDTISEEEAIRSYEVAMNSMTRLNRNAAMLMHKYKSHGATDVTGFGILGHATNLAKYQILKNLHFVIHTLPIIKNMKEVEEKLECMFNLMKGYSAETSGGLLICLPKENAEAFCNELLEKDGQPAWIVGYVTTKPTVSNGDNSNSQCNSINSSLDECTHSTCSIIDNPTVIIV